MFRLWTTTTIPDAERGLRHRGGRLVRWLEPGRHTLWLPGEGTWDARLDLTPGFAPHTPELEAIVPPGHAEVLDVGFRHVALLKVDGIPVRALGPGRYLLWQVRQRVEATVYSTEPLVTSIPEACWGLVGPERLLTVVVHPYERVVLYVDGARADVLGPGRHGIHCDGRVVSAVRVDLREQELQITGQDVMSADKVSLRINLIVRFRVVDPALALSSVVNLRDALYGAAQLAARRLVAGTRLEDLLEGRNDAGLQMRAEVAPPASAWGVELVGLDLKDLILPGDMKDLLNQVIAAEKQAAANVILRREETAATRSLANTAKLLDQNPTLLRLKELEALERLAAKVGDVTVVAAPDQLLGTLRLP
jgi:regulator of protease activity HflC (stomatin/prohibitin superfamily)